MLALALKKFKNLKKLIIKKIITKKQFQKNVLKIKQKIIKNHSKLKKI